MHGLGQEVRCITATAAKMESCLICKSLEGAFPCCADSLLYIYVPVSLHQLLESCMISGRFYLFTCAMLYYANANANANTRLNLHIHLHPSPPNRKP